MRWYRYVVLVPLIVMVALPAVMLAQNDVTFGVRLNVKILEGLFNPSTDSVVVRGDFQGWAGNANFFTDADGDSVYTGTYNVGSTSPINYKFVLVGAAHGGGTWEGDPNRTLDLTGSAQTLPEVYFDRDSVVSLSTAITFQVNMSVKILEGVFTPGGTDKVVVRGNFNGWGGNTNECTDADGDSVYAGTFDILGSPGDEELYKFVMVTSAGDTWEDNIPSNRKFTQPASPTTLDVVYFDDDQIVSLPVSGNLLWQIDMTAMEQLGWFQRASGDSMQVRGGFNGWAETDPALSSMDRIPGTELYQLVTPYSGFSGDPSAHKYFMNMNEAAAATRFPGFADNTDGIQYEHPAERGDGNRQYILPQSGGDAETPLFYFSDINPNGIVPSGKTITLTFQYDMTPALTHTDPFVPASDTLLLLIEDPIWRTTTGVALSNNSSTGIQFSDPDADGIWTAQMPFTGPAHYNVQYRVRYVHSDNTQVDESAGLGAQKPYNSRFIAPNGPQDFPDAYTFPVDTWKADPPRTSETAPFSTVTSVEPVKNLGIPLRYSLEQNFPNPFNPSTVIRYSIPVKGRVTLTLFNILGQEVLRLLNTEQDAGTYDVRLNATNIPSGVYFYRLESGTFVEAKKLMLIK